MTQTLDLFPIGNCAASGLIDRAGRLAWACAPRVDGDPMFCALLGDDPDANPDAHGFWDVQVENQAHYAGAELADADASDIGVIGAYLGHQLL